MWRSDGCLEELRRRVAALPPGKPQRPMWFLLPSWSTLRLLPQCFSLHPRPSLSTSRLRLQCTQHQHPLWKFFCGKTCALSPARDVGLGKMVFVVACRDTWFAADVDTFHFTVCQRRAVFLLLQVSAELSMCGSLAAPLLVC